MKYKKISTACNAYLTIARRARSNLAPPRNHDIRRSSMDTTLVATRSLGRTPLAALGKLTVAALVGIVLMLIIVQAALIGQFDLSLTLYALVTLLVAGVVALG